jgi:hypothetical protein
MLWDRHVAARLLTAAALLPCAPLAAQEQQAHNAGQHPRRSVAAIGLESKKPLSGIASCALTISPISLFIVQELHHFQ